MVCIYYISRPDRRLKWWKGLSAVQTDIIYWFDPTEHFKLDGRAPKLIYLNNNATNCTVIFEFVSSDDVYFYYCPTKEEFREKILLLVCRKKQGVDKWEDYFKTLPHEAAKRFSELRY